MQIKLLFFGIVKDITHKSEETFTISDKTTVFNLKKLLFTNYAELNKFSNFSVAVNEAYADDSQELLNNDVVAIIPPVSGG